MMKDHFGRSIDYLRVSITDRCNLRCRYCVPNGTALVRHEDILRFEEILRLCGQAVALGLTKFKVTGGEPLVRKGCAAFLRDLKALPGVEQVTLTTNGLLLLPLLDELDGLDGVNISIDTLDPDRYAALTGFSGSAVPRLLQTLDACLERGIKTKVNAVLLEETRDDWEGLAALARRNVDVRLIECMPIGAGAAEKGVRSEEVLTCLRTRWPDLHPVQERRGNGPARYFASEALTGRIGLIDAVSHPFCQSCNRVRLTSTGLWKPCLCYETAVDLRRLLRNGGTDEAIRGAMEQAILEKPAAHCFGDLGYVSERKTMNQIGG